MDDLTSINISDGFQELHVYRGHNHPVKHIGLMDAIETRAGSNVVTKKRLFLTYDSTCVNLWDPILGTQKTIKFPKTSPNFISAITYISPLKIFFASALDMCFKIYDKKFKLVESIRHSERSILNIEYSASKGLLLISGANGVSCWRIFRAPNHNRLKLQDVSVHFVIEKVFQFANCNVWISNLIYDEPNDKIFGIKETSIFVFSLGTRMLDTTLGSIHESPVTRACFYPRSQYYITGCSGGLVKVWASHKASNNNAVVPTQPKSPTGGLAGSSIFEHSFVLDENFELLHTFHQFTKAVTGLVMHPVVGLCISSGADGYIKVTNLEALQELFTIQTTCDILNLITFPLSGQNYVSGGYAAMFAMSDGSVNLWKITSCLEFFNIGLSKVETITPFDNLHYKRDLAEYEAYQRLCKRIEDKKIEEEHQRSVNMELKKMKSMRSRGRTLSSMSQLSTKSMTNEDDMSYLKPGEAQLSTLSVDSSIFSDQNSTSVIENEEVVKKEEVLPEIAPIAPLERCIVSYAGLDIRVFNESGALLGRLDPHHSSNNIIALTVSAHVNVLLCIFENGLICAYCLRTPNCPALKSYQLPHFESEKSTCLVLVDEIPRSVAGAGSSDGGRPRSDNATDPRGNPSPIDLTEILVIGTDSGSLVCLDLMDDFNPVCTNQIEQGSITELSYKSHKKELFTMGYGIITQGASSSSRVNGEASGDPTHKHRSDANHLHSFMKGTIKVWKLPDMVILMELDVKPNISVWGLAPISDLLVIGCNDGYSHLYEYSNVAEKTEHPMNGHNGLNNDSESISTVSQADDASHVHSKLLSNTPTDHWKVSFVELHMSGQTHKDKITSVHFSEALELYVTASLDSTILIFNYKKMVVRCVHLNIPTTSAVFIGNDGYILMSQQHYLLKISKKTWNQGHLLESLHEAYDPWQIELPPPEAIIGQIEGSDNDQNEKIRTAEDVAHMKQMQKNINTNAHIDEQLQEKSNSKNNSKTDLPNIYKKGEETNPGNRIFLTENAIVIRPDSSNINERKPDGPHNEFNTPMINKKTLMNPATNAKTNKNKKRTVKFSDFVNNMLIEVHNNSKTIKDHEKKLAMELKEKLEKSSPKLKVKQKQLHADMYGSSIKRRGGMTLTLDENGSYVVSNVKGGVNIGKLHSDTIARRIAVIGMSPRARMTMLYSRPASTAEKERPAPFIEETESEWESDQETESEEESMTEKSVSSSVRRNQSVHHTSKLQSSRHVTLTNENEAVAEGDKEDGSSSDEDSDAENKSKLNLLLKARLKNAFAVNPLMSSRQTNEGWKKISNAVITNDGALFEEVVDGDEHNIDNTADVHTVDTNVNAESIVVNAESIVDVSHHSDARADKHENHADRHRSGSVSSRKARLTVGIAGGENYDNRPNSKNGNHTDNVTDHTTMSNTDETAGTEYGYIRKSINKRSFRRNSILR